MRRPVMRVGAIAAMLAGMMGAGAQAQGHQQEATTVQSTKLGTKKQKQQIASAHRNWGYTRPAAPGNQRQWRKKWRNAPHSRLKANKR